MKSDSVLQQVITALHRRHRWIERGKILLDTLLLCLCCLVALLFWHRFIFPLPAISLITMGIAGIGIIGASFLLWWRKPTPGELLIQADRQLRLRERLSTAYEIAQSETHPFQQILLAEATRVAPAVVPKRVFPWQFSRRLWGIVPLLLACSVLLFWDLLSVPAVLSSSTPAVTESQIRAEFTKLEKFAQRLEQRARQERLEKSRALARRMQNLEASLRLEEPPRQQAVARVSSLLDYVRNLQEELQKESLMTDLEIQQIREVFLSRENLAQELQQILQMLSRGTFGTGDIGTAERTLEELINLMGKEGAALSKELQEALKNLRSGDVKGAQQILQTLLMQQKLAEDHENLRRAEQALRDSAQALHNLPQSVPSVSDMDGLEGGDTENQMANRRQGVPGEMGSGGFGEEDIGGLDYEGGYRSSRQPGLTSGAEQESAQQQLGENSSAQLAQKIEGQTGEGEIHRVYIKALPLKSSSALPLEEVIVEYQHRVEESMLQEEIPIQYRDYIRNYFLAIGVFGGSDGTEQSSPDNY